MNRHLVSPIVAAAIAMFAFLAGFVAAPDVCARPKTDSVTLKNGDHITCEIKELSRGKLTVKTDAAGTIYIEWEDIVALESQYYFRFESKGGRRVYGTPKLHAGEQELRVRSLDTEITISRAHVVEITPIERSFWSAIDGSFSFGYSYTKASDVSQFTLNWATQYRTARNYLDLDISSILTDRNDDEEAARRNVVSLSLTRLLSHQRWFGTVKTGIERNDELGIGRRVTGALTVGINPLKSNRNLLLFSAGVSVNSENAVDSVGTNESLEGVVSVSYSLYVYNTPKRDIDFDASIFPSVTEQGRVRGHTDIKIRYEIVKNLFFDLSFYYDIDNQPPSGASRALDYGIVTSVGLTY